MTNHTNIFRHRIPDTKDDALVLDFLEGAHFYGHEPGNVFCVLYVEYSHVEDGRKIYNAVCTQYFAATNFEEALSCFRKRRDSDMPSRATEKEGSLDKALPKKGFPPMDDGYQWARDVAEGRRT
jgi:hypothetical protein